MFQLIWLSGSAATALGIAIDMHRLRINRLGISRAGWVIASVVGGPVAGVFYLFRRPSARRTLIEHVWQLAGGASAPPEIRLRRLQVLRDSGLIGPAIFRACLQELRTETLASPKIGDL